MVAIPLKRSSTTMQTGKVGDHALHVVEIPAELEGEWRVEEDFLAAVKSKGRVLPHPNFEDGLRYMSRAKLPEN